MQKTLLALILLSFFFTGLAEARVGGGRSFGSRGSRSMAPRSAPSPYRPYNNYNSRPAEPARPNSGYGQPAPQPSPFGGGGFLRNLGAGIAGGMIGSLLFRNSGWAGNGMGVGGGGGIGLLEIILLAAVGFFVFRWLKNRNGPSANVAPPEVYTYSEASQVPVQPGSFAATSAGTDAPAADDVARVLSQYENNFTVERFTESRVDDFFQMQAALMNRELTPVRDRVTPEIFSILENDVASLKNAGKINRIENIAVREAEIVEAWEEPSAVYATLRLKANLLDYTVDEKTGAVIGGNPTSPIKFDEYWTFVRPQAGGADWKLSAIQNNA